MEHEHLSKQERQERRARRLAAIDAVHEEIMRERGVQVVESAVDQLETQLFALALDQFLRRPPPKPPADAGNGPH